MDVWLIYGGAHLILLKGHSARKMLRHVCFMASKVSLCEQGMHTLWGTLNLSVLLLRLCLLTQHHSSAGYVAALRWPVWAESLVLRESCLFHAFFSGALFVLSQVIFGLNFQFPFLFDS
jgi:hypothetical protein